MTLISSNGDLCIVHIPKTGGTARKRVFQKIGWRHCSYGTQHVRLCDFEVCYKRSADSFKQILVVVREPCERELSHWAFARGDNTKGIAFDIPRKHKSVNTFVEDWRCTPLYYYERGYHQGLYRHTREGCLEEYQQQDGYRYWTDIRGVTPDNVVWVKLENQDEALSRILNQSIAIPRRHVSTHGSVCEEYTPEGLAVVRATYWWTYASLYSEG